LTLRKLAYLNMKLVKNPKIIPIASDTIPSKRN
jgi:hypothetical protein